MFTVQIRWCLYFLKEVKTVENPHKTSKVCEIIMWNNSVYHPTKNRRSNSLRGGLLPQHFQFVFVRTVDKKTNTLSTEAQWCSACNGSTEYCCKVSNSGNNFACKDFGTSCGIPGGQSPKSWHMQWISNHSFWKSMWALTLGNLSSTTVGAAIFRRHISCYVQLSRSFRFLSLSRVLVSLLSFCSLKQYCYVLYFRKGWGRSRVKASSLLTCPEDASAFSSLFQLYFLDAQF